MKCHPMKALLKTIGVCLFIIITTPILWVLDVYASVAHPERDTDEYKYE